MSNCVSFSKYSISFSVSVDLVAFMACAMILNEMYSIQAWFSGGFSCFLVKAATKALEAAVSRSWCQTVGQVPLRLPSPAAQASAVLRLNPTIGYGRAQLGDLFVRGGGVVGRG